MSADTWSTFVSAVAGALGGALGALVISGLYSLWRHPKLKVHFGNGPPFEVDAKAANGRIYRFLHVRISNIGRSSARACKVFVRKIEFAAEGEKSQVINCDRMMQTNWVPREADLFSIDIPAGLEFLADLVHDNDVGGRRVVVPIFQASLSLVDQFQTLSGTYFLEIIAVSDNASTARATVRFRFNGQPLGLFAEGLA